MRCMMIVRASKDSEAGVMPSEELLSAMGKYNEELVKAGVLLDAAGTPPSSKGFRIQFSGGKRTVIDGPFRGDQGAHRRILDHSGEVQGGGNGMGPAHPGSPRRWGQSRDTPVLEAIDHMREFEKDLEKKK